MKSIKNLERLQVLHSLIEKEQTGTSLEIARKMHISQRLVYNLIEELKEYEADVRYDRGRKTYYYNDDFKLQFNISILITNENSTTEILNGSYL